MRPAVRGPGCGRIRRVVLVVALAAVVVTLGALPTAAQDESQGGDVGQSPLADLLIKSLTEEFAQDGAQLTLTVDVLNAAAGEADATSVTAEAAGWETGEEPLSALGSQEDKVVVLTFEVPDDARGQEALFRVEVDPADAVTEHREDNNVDRIAVEVPSGEAGEDPDSGEEQEDLDGDGEQEDLENGEDSGGDGGADPPDLLRLVASAVLPAVPVAVLIILVAAVAVVAIRAVRNRVRPPPNVRMEAHAAPPPDLRVREADDRRTVIVRIEPRRGAGDTRLEEVSE